MKKFLFAAAIILIAASQAQAYDRNTISLGLGVDVLRDDLERNNDDSRSGEARIQWRGKEINPDDLLGISNFSPFVGLDVDTRGATAVYAGILYDWNFYGGFHFIPNIGASAYFHGDGKDLGGPLEFHDSLELDYAIDSVSSIGVAFTHMSNAGIYDHNPGKEDVMATYSFAY